MGAKPHWSQVGRYLPRLRALRGPGYLSWLIPATAKTDADPVEGVQVRTWQDLAFVLDRWNRLVSPENRNSINFRLVEEFVRHLWEERGAVTGGIDRDDAASLGRYELALKRLQGVIRLAAERVHAQRRVAHAGRPKGAPACGSSSTYSTTNAGPRARTLSGAEPTMVSVGSRAGRSRSALG